jgi:hypothetical protein
MNDQMRVEFEAAVTERYGKQHEGAFDRFIDGDYKRPSMMNLWWAWQASRAAVVVELPEDWEPVSEKDEGAREMRDACVDAIQSAGVSVK